MKENIIAELEKLSFERIEGGRTYRSISLEATESCAKKFGVTTREVSILALENGFLPLKYAKNIGTLGLGGQEKLLRSKVTVLGAGGIGGHVCMLLARMGTGQIVIVDKDIFDETNLNRQCFATEEVLGQSKVDVALSLLSKVNSDVEIVTRKLEADSKNLPSLLKDADVVIDALDTLSDRLMLQDACRNAGVVMVHGAIAGSCVQVTTIYPGDSGLRSLVPQSATSPRENGTKVRGIEVETGNPATTPALAAAIQVQEAIKVITGLGDTLRGRMLFLDIENWTIDFVEL